jgi:peptide/nickel transport system ATP-binding protein
MGPPLLETRTLGRVFPGRRRGFGGRSSPTVAVDDVSITVQRGRNLGIVGESGSGKSTLARLVMALDRPTSGAVIHQGRDVGAQSPDALRAMRREFQMVFQDPFGSLDPRQRVGRSIADPLLALGDQRSYGSARPRVEEALSAVGLPAGALDRFPHEFSGGQRQRIAIARATITRPALVVADEPVSALDVSIQAQVLNLLIDLHDQWDVTYLFISHDLAVVRHIAHEIAVMYAGRVVESGPTAQVFDEPKHPYTQALIEAIPRAGSAARPATSRPGAELRDATPAGCPYYPRCPMATDQCAGEMPLLRRIEPGRQVACHEARGSE